MASLEPKLLHVRSHRTEAFEGAFMNRSTYQSPTDKGVTVFGFGMMGRPIGIDGNTFERFFLEKVR
ncbi:MAG: hypothetical protein ACJ79Q_07135 [Gemmatimonadaceae bacterium]